MRPPVVPDEWDRCHVYLPNKHRFCRQERRDGSVYCGNHQHLLSEGHETNPIHCKRKRIRCPIDQSHYIFEDSVDKHCKVCPLANKRRKQAEQPYYHENLNAGGHGDLGEFEHSLDDKVGNRQPESKRKSTTMTLEDAQKLALRLLHVHHLVFPSSDHNKDTLAANSVSWCNLHDAISMEDLSDPDLKAGIVEAFRAHHAKAGGDRHVRQLASLVGHLRKLKVLPREPSPLASKGELPAVTFLEMGAGRGMLGLTAAGVAAASGIPTELVMVERTGARSKADKVFRTIDTKNESRSYMKLDTVKWSRIECDLAHVSLPKVLEASDRNQCDQKHVVIIAKHLCGAGTDLALKSMESIQGRVHSCLMATCCHGLCDWKLYVGRDSLRKLMTTDTVRFGPEHFEVMRQWCAASVACPTKKTDDSQQEVLTDPSGCSRILEEDEADHPIVALEMEASTRISISTVVSALELKCGIEGLGRVCQRLIDYGRLQYLSENIFKDTLDSSGLCHYVPHEVSPQNACIFGRKGSHREPAIPAE